MRFLVFLLMFVSLESFAQSETLELLKNYEFRYSKSEWHINDSKIIKKSYQKQYTIERNKQNSKLSIDIITIDVASKNKNYPEQKSGEMTSSGELKKYKNDLIKSTEEDTTIALKFVIGKAYKSYKIILVERTSTTNPEEVTYYAAARHVIHRFFIVGMNLENIQCKSTDEARKMLIEQLKKIKDES